MHWDINYYLDRSILSDLPDSLSQVLRNQNFVTKSGEKASFCGLVLTESVQAVFLPRSTHLSAGVSKATTSMFKAFRRYDKELAPLIRNNEQVAELFGSKRISLLYSLLEDYRTYGIYNQRNLHKRINSGKPDWPRTISKFQPYISNGRPVYCDYVGVKKRVSVDSEISKIHAFLVSLIDTKFGSIFFGEKSYNEDGLSKPSFISREFFRAIINKELRNVYSDRDVRLMKLLLKALDVGVLDDSVDFVIGTRSFHTVWEHMLKKVVEGAIELNDKLPFPIYEDSSGKLYPAKRNSQKTDIVIENSRKNLYAIVDAKYYDATSQSSSPRWHDLVKQFFYEKAISVVYPESTVKNYFIFPGEEQVFAKAFMANRKDYSPVSDYAEIGCIYVNPTDVTQAYSKGIKLIELSEKLNS
ncbi:LlaJI family restriction endonuclease [Alteromonas pelagimontana]|uniref:LlaJI family restriction endonuclease n=1 Tax=Alteromonas pelagimontana TaxID=1858656 RepID=A0A6M4MEL2_9ALTE|nr:LlaJI family restriction endonuclease [Alteromonas pelagimontana]QJR81060.1 LlaJI family restriction endonuclease [Alteromonas pelagimontana]